MLPVDHSHSANMDKCVKDSHADGTRMTTRTHDYECNEGAYVETMTYVVTTGEQKIGIINEQDMLRATQHVHLPYETTFGPYTLSDAEEFWEEWLQEGKILRLNNPKATKNTEPEMTTNPARPARPATPVTLNTTSNTFEASTFKANTFKCNTKRSTTKKCKPEAEQTIKTKMLGRSI